MPYRLVDKRAYRDPYSEGVFDWCTSSIQNPLIPSHNDRWVLTRSYGSVAHEYECAARFRIEPNGFDGLIDDGKTYTCFGVLRKSSGRYKWPTASERSPRNTNKRAVYEALEQLGNVATVSQIAEAARVSKGIVHNTLIKGARAGGKHRAPYTIRSEERRPQPEGSAHEWGLTQRGKDWLKWSRRQNKTN